MKRHLLADHEILKLHQAALRVLESTGMRITHSPGRRLLQSAGCRVESGDIVRFPQEMVDEHLAMAPSTWTLYSRTGKEALHLGGPQACFGPGTDLPYILDLHTSRRRTCRMDDVAQAALLADGLEELDFVSTQLCPANLPPHLVHVQSFKAVLEHSSKPVLFTAGSARELEFMEEMASAARGDASQGSKPFLIHFLEATSPLTLSVGMTKRLLFCASRGLPAALTSGPLRGAGAPLPLSGAVVQAHAEVLGAVALHQLKNPGAPVIAGFGVGTMNMATAEPLFATPEYTLAREASGRLFHLLGLPTWGAGGFADEHELDHEAAFQGVLSLLSFAPHGIDLIQNVASMGKGSTGSPLFTVFIVEMLGYLKRFTQGLKLDHVEGDLQEIGEVGPGGSFLGTDRTFRLHGGEEAFSSPRRGGSVEECRQGSWGKWECARKRALEIMEAHRPAPLPPHAREELRRILEEADRALAGTGFEA